MEYNKVKNADNIVNSSSYLIKNPASFKNNYSKLFGNNNPICLELGMGRGSFIIGMAKNTPITIQKYQFTPKLKKSFI